MRSAGLLAAPLLSLLLAGCITSTSRPTTGDAAGRAALWQARQEQIARIGSFNLTGRIGSGLGLKGDLFWRQQADGSFDLRLAGPFGVRPVSIRGDAQRVEIRSAEGSFTTADPEDYVQRRLGWTFPLRSLRWWVLGLPVPGAAQIVELDAQGRPQTLEQSGWRVRYIEYRTLHDGRELPRLLEAELIGSEAGAPAGEVMIRVLADRWEGLDALPAP